MPRPVDNLRVFNKVNKILLIPVSPAAVPSRNGPTVLGPGRDLFTPIKPQDRLTIAAPLSVLTGVFLLLNKYGRKGPGYKKEVSIEAQKPGVIILRGDLKPRFSIRKSSREGNYEILPGSYKDGRYVPWEDEIVVDGRPLVAESWFPLQEGDLIQSGDYYFIFQLSEEEPVERRKKEIRTLEERAAALQSTVDERERKARDLESVDVEFEQKTAALAGVKGELASQEEALEGVRREHNTTKANLETANQDLERLLKRITAESVSWEDRLSEAGKTLRSQEATTASLKSDAEEFERKVVRLGEVEAELREKTAALAGVKGELASQEEALKTLNKEHAGVNMALEMATQVLQTKNDDAAAAESRKGAAEQALKSAQEEAAALRGEVAELERKKEELGPIDATWREHKEAVVEAEAELKKKREELGGVKREIVSRRGNLEMADEVLRTKKEEEAEWTQKVRQAKEALAPLETRRQELEPYLERLEKERTDLEQRVGELRRQSEELGPEVADLEEKREERIRLISDIETKKAELGRMVDEWNYINGELGKLRGTLEEQGAQKAWLDEAIRQAKENEPILRGVVASLTTEANELREGIAQLRPVAEEWEKRKNEIGELERVYRQWEAGVAEKQAEWTRLEAAIKGLEGKKKLIEAEIARLEGRRRNLAPPLEKVIVSADLAEAAPLPVPPWARKIKLTRIKAAGEEEPVEIQLDESGRAIFGREKGAAYVIELDSVSRRHAEILFRDGQFFLQDLDSAYGTGLNNQRLDKKSGTSKKPYPLHVGDQFHIMGALFRVSSLPEDPETARSRLNEPSPTRRRDK